MSPLLFNVYMDVLSSSLSNTPTGCAIGGVMVNHIMYADDLATIVVLYCMGLQSCCVARNKHFTYLLTYWV